MKVIFRFYIYRLKTWRKQHRCKIWSNHLLFTMLGILLLVLKLAFYLWNCWQPWIIQLNFIQLKKKFHKILIYILYIIFVCFSLLFCNYSIINLYDFLYIYFNHSMKISKYRNHVTFSWMIANKKPYWPLSKVIYISHLYEESRL